MIPARPARLSKAQQRRKIAALMSPDMEHNKNNTQLLASRPASGYMQVIGTMTQTH
jgi:hypothetical protein